MPILKPRPPWAAGNCHSK